MTNDSVEAALQAATEFLWAVQALRDADRAKGITHMKNQPYVGSKYTAALRRKSMELTRALAEMRKP